MPEEQGLANNGQCSRNDLHAGSQCVLGAQAFRPKLMQQCLLEILHAFVLLANIIDEEKNGRILLALMRMEADKMDIFSYFTSLLLDRCAVTGPCEQLVVIALILACC